MNSKNGIFGVFFIGCVFCAALVSCTGTQVLKTEKLEIRTADGLTIPLSTEIARTPAEQEKGYMERKEIPDGTAMIFIYTADQRMNFWMKNTPHPLSIAFLDSKGTIREIYDMSAFSLETISSVRSLRYALEVPQLWFTRASIKEGDSLTEESLAKLLP